MWENKKTHLKQAGHYVSKELTEEELAEMEYDEESGPPKPQAPLWKGLVWNPDGMTFVDPPTAPAVEVAEPEAVPVEQPKAEAEAAAAAPAEPEPEAEASAEPAVAEDAVPPPESAEGAAAAEAEAKPAAAEEEAKPAEA